MRPLILTGVAVAAAGLFGLALEHLVLASPEAIIDSGSIKVMARTDRFFPLSTIAGVLATVTGIALVYLGRTPKPADRVH